jgi:hypothetical protein
MLATQYAIPLPADYDMTVIRRRVAERGHLLDDRPGLRLKAYLVQDTARGATRNQYAPFYLWADTGAAASFLWGGGGFAGIVRDFGRPTVTTWLGVELRRGPAHGASAAWATLDRRPLPAGEDPSAEAERLRRVLDDGAGDDGVHSIAAAIDPTRWESVIFTLRATEASVAPGGTVFEVLHLSEPQADTLGAPASSGLR